jgi:hypothetical protein
MNRLTPQHQPRLVNKPSFAVARSYVDQLVRTDAIDVQTLVQVTNAIDRAERFRTGRQGQAARDRLRFLANRLEGEQYENLREALLALANM